MKNSFIASSLTLVCILACPATAMQPQEAALDLSCIVSREDADGRWSASRNLTVKGEAIEASRDTYEWRPSSELEFAPGMTLRWRLTYYWPTTVGKQNAIAAEEVMVRFGFRFDAETIGASLKRPSRSWLHLYRSTDLTKNPRSGATSLTSEMWWDGLARGNLAATAVISLDELLAFGTGRDALLWNIRSAPDSNGATQVAGKGLLPLALMRHKTKEIHELRRALDKRVANYRTFCKAPIMVTVP